MDTNSYLDNVKASYDLPSDYKLAQKLDISRHRLSAYRTTNRNMDDELCLTIEKLLKLPQGAILLDIHAQRSKCITAKRLFEKLSKQLIKTGMATTLALSVFQIYPCFSSDGIDNVINANTVYYVKWHNAVFTPPFLSPPWPQLKLTYPFFYILLISVFCYSFVTERKTTRSIDAVNGERDID